MRAINGMRTRSESDNGGQRSIDDTVGEVDSARLLGLREGALGEWSVETVGEFLSAIGLPQYQRHFKRHNVDGAALLRFGVARGAFPSTTT